MAKAVSSDIYHAFPISPKLNQNGLTLMRRPWVAEELKRAHTELASATDDVAKQRLNEAIFSAYYAVFHATRAVLYHYGLAPATHKGVLIEFNRCLIRSRRLSEKRRDIYDELRSERESADYHSYTRSLTQADAENLVILARRFVDRMEQLLEYDPM